MSSLFRNKYRIGSIRYLGYDYSSPGRYFITICTKCKIPSFGDVENGEMILSEIGMIAKKLWQEIPDHFQFIELDEFIIMPDHIHGIIIINRNTVSNTDSDPIIVETPKLGVSTSVVSSSMAGISSESSSNTGTSAKKSIKLKNPYWKSNSIGSIINQYKRICTITIKSCGYDFQWQSRFYDRIIRSSSELIRIRKYIINNPINWKR